MYIILWPESDFDNHDGVNLKFTETINDRIFTYEDP